MTHGVRSALTMVGAVAMAAVAAGTAWCQDAAGKPVGVVSHVTVLSDKVADVSSMEAWKKFFIKDGMTDQQKAVAIWKSVVMHRYQDSPPIEFLHEGCVHDAIKVFNVYGYGMCCCASANIEELARYVGLEARAWSINGHNVPEVFYDGAWHMLDASLVNYFPKPDGGIASVEEIVAAVKGWLEKNPEYRCNDAKLREFHKEGGKLRVFFSDNNGLDWREVVSLEKPGPQKIDLQKLVLRRYDYRLRLILSGKGTGLESLRIANLIQCSERALPTLAKGENRITFLAGPPEGTITIEGTSYGNARGKNVSLADFNPVLNNVEPQYFRVKGQPAEVTIPIATPGAMTRLRFGGFFRARDKADQWDAQVSLDGGKTFPSVDTYAGPTQGKCRYTTVADIPAGTKEAVIRWSGQQRNTTCLFAARIDADYQQPQGGFRPVKITYVWEEGGIEKRDVHLAAGPRETYVINCPSKPEMKSIVLELEK